MAKVLRTLAPVDSMSGMVGKRDETVSNKAFIVNLKKQGGWKMKGAPFMYFSLRQNDRLSSPSIDEKKARQNFAAAVRATYDRMVDPTKLPADQAAFIKQTKYPTFYGYVFSVVYAEIAAQ
jgi:hypothetical protein